ncbi:MAG: cation transporter [bacterium]|nr:cation transporter [bacterium]
MIILALATAVLEFWGSNESGSLALLGDAWHVVSDILVYLVAIFVGVLVLKKNKDKTKTIKGVWAVRNANILILVAVSTMALAAWRISHPVEVMTDVMLWVSAIGLAANGVMYFVLKAFRIEHEHENKGHDHLHDTTIIHTLNDLGISFAVVITGKLMEAYPWIIEYRPDSIASIIICVWLIEVANKTKREAEKSMAAEQHDEHYHQD